MGLNVQETCQPFITQRDEAPVKQNRSNPVKKKLLDVTKAKGFRVINDENNIVHNINYTVEFMGQVIKHGHAKKRQQKNDEKNIQHTLRERER